MNEVKFCHLIYFELRNNFGKVNFWSGVSHFRDVTGQKCFALRHLVYLLMDAGSKVLYSQGSNYVVEIGFLCCH